MGAMGFQGPVETMQPTLLQIRGIQLPNKHKMPILFLHCHERVGQHMWRELERKCYSPESNIKMQIV